MTRTVAVGIQSLLHTDALQGVEARASVEELLAPGPPSLMSAIGTKRTRSSPKPMTAHRLKADLEAAAKRAQRVCDAPLIDYVQLSEIGGEGGIRTHGTLARTTVFETAPFNHSGTFPIQ